MDNYSIVNLDALGRRIPEEEPTFLVCLKSAFFFSVWQAERMRTKTN